MKILKTVTAVIAATANYLFTGSTPAMADSRTRASGYTPDGIELRTGTALRRYAH